MNRRRFVKVASSAGLGIAAVERMSAALADIIQEAPSRKHSTKNVIITNASLIDSVQLEPQFKATVVVKDGRITRVGTLAPTRTERQEAAVIDLGGAWLLAGLFDVHCHLSSPLQAPPPERQPLIFTCAWGRRRWMPSS